MANAVFMPKQGITVESCILTAWKVKVGDVVKKGDVLGTVDFYSGDKQIGSVDITAAENVDKMSFLTAFLWILHGLIQ